jgi:hypothetical protein
LSYWLTVKVEGEDFGFLKSILIKEFCEEENLPTEITGKKTDKSKKSKRAKTEALLNTFMLFLLILLLPFGRYISVQRAIIGLRKMTKNKKPSRLRHWLILASLAPILGARIHSLVVPFYLGISLKTKNQAGCVTGSLQSLDAHLGILKVIASWYLLIFSFKLHILLYAKIFFVKRSIKKFLSTFT